LVTLENWMVDPESWDRDKLGPWLNEPNNRILPDIKLRFTDRLRKRQQRQEERRVAMARQATADQELRTALLTACNGNHAPTLAADDLAPIKEVLKVLPLDRVAMVIRQKIDRRSYPANPPLVSWRDPVFLRLLAEDFCQAFAIPGLVKEWNEAAKRPAKHADAPKPSPGAPGVCSTGKRSAAVPRQAPSPILTTVR
jgi:hypothetical protein